jgi:Family of unknown function (DUF6188)
MSEDAKDALAILRPVLIGRSVTRVLLDYAVTLEFFDRASIAELKIETPFAFVEGHGVKHDIEPANLGADGERVAGLFLGVVAAVGIGSNGTLELDLQDGRSLIVPRHGDFESWSFVDDTGARVICLPSGDLAIWGSKGKPV